MLTRRLAALLAAALATGGLAAEAASAATISRSDSYTLLFDGDAAEAPRDGVRIELVSAGTQVKFEIVFPRQCQNITPVAPCLFENQSASDPDARGGDDVVDRAAAAGPGHARRLDRPRGTLPLRRRALPRIDLLCLAPGEAAPRRC